MISPLVQDDDDERVRILKLYNIHGTQVEEEYDSIAKLANSICGTQVSLISFIDSKKQWFKAHLGTDLKENTRELALCSHAINNKNNTTYIPNLSRDIRFKHHPMVTGPANLQFYAGVPIMSPEGYALGTICVMDTKSKNLDSMQLEALVVLRDLVAKLLAIRRRDIHQEE